MPITLLQNTGLNDTQTSESTSTVCEPTMATNERQAFATGNWFASTSSDGGVSWTLVDPYTRFRPAQAVSAATRSSSTTPATASGSGCCSTAGWQR